MSKSLNQSGIRPVGRAVLVEPYEAEKLSSIIAIPDSVKGRMDMLETRCVVIEAGPAAWSDESQPRAKPGDKVMITKFGGALLQGVKDGRTYRMVNDRDIYCVIED
jgi:co-chaperonin GroES (HSP10)